MDELLSQQKCQSFNILSSPDRPEHVMRCPYINCQSESALGRAADEEARPSPCIVRCSFRLSKGPGVSSGAFNFSRQQHSTPKSQAIWKGD